MPKHDNNEELIAGLRFLFKGKRHFKVQSSLWIAVQLFLLVNEPSHIHFSCDKSLFDQVIVDFTTEILLFPDSKSTGGEDKTIGL